MLLINLNEDPDEKNNLAEKYPEKLNQMLYEMDSMLQAMGDLPPALVIKTDADNSHYDYLIEKYGEDYYLPEK